MHAAVTFMCALPSKTFETYVIEQCLFAELVPGRALWVPYGWRSVLLTRTQVHYSHALHIPCVSARMLQASACKHNIITIAKQAMQECGRSMGEPCLSLAKEAGDWLNKVATLEDDIVETSRVTLMAIEDSRE